MAEEKKKVKPSGKKKGMKEAWTEVFKSFSVFSERGKTIERKLREAETGKKSDY